MNTRVQLQEAFKLALSITLFYWFTLAMDWSMPKYGVLAIALVSAATAGDSLFKGFVRSVGTLLGAIIGFGLLIVFPQNPVGLMLSVALLLVVVTYVAQTSRYQGVWTMVAIMAILVWFTGYGNLQHSFHFAVFRTLETICGVMFYTVVSVLLWPITAESRLMTEGCDLWTRVTELGYRLRQRLDGEDDGEAELTDARHEVAGALMKLEKTLPAVYSDSWATVSRKRIWEGLRCNLRALVDAMDHWRLILDDVRPLDPGRILPGLDATLGTLQARLERFGEIWGGGGDAGDDAAKDDGLLEPLSLETSGAAELTSSKRAVLALFVEALGGVDRSSREVLRSLRILADLDSPDGFVCSVESTPLRRPSLWNLGRFLNSLLPAVCWIIGFGLWIHVNLPGGPIVALLASVFAMMLSLHPMNLFELLKWILISIWFVIMPAYLFIMPSLDSTAGLLGFILVSCFVLGWLGAKMPLLKMTSLAMFAMLIDVSNHQIYSFMKVLSLTMIVTSGVGLAALVYQLLQPLHPANLLRRELRLFFAACGRVMEGFSLHETDERQGRGIRKTAFASRIMPVPQRLAGLAKQLATLGLSATKVDDLQSLVDGTEVLSLRLEALEYTHEKAVTVDSAFGASMDDTSESLATKLRGVFERWSESGNDARVDLVAIGADLDRSIEAMQTVADEGKLGAEELRKFYVLTGSLRGLLDTMSALNQAIVPVREMLHEPSQ